MPAAAPHPWTRAAARLPAAMRSRRRATVAASRGGLPSGGGHVPCPEGAVRSGLGECLPERRRQIRRQHRRGCDPPRARFATRQATDGPFHAASFFGRGGLPIAATVAIRELESRPREIGLHPLLPREESMSRWSPAAESSGCCLFVWGPVSEAFLSAVVHDGDDSQDHIGMIFCYDLLRPLCSRIIGFQNLRTSTHHLPGRSEQQFKLDILEWNESKNLRLVLDTKEFSGARET